jgi:putative toxin-antitoxin system antitoxin component (TIGR02293 family)
LPEEIAFTTQLTGLTQQDLTEKLGLSTRTLQRKVKENKRLSPEKSDRLFRLQRLTGAALELFEGDVAAMQRWLKTPLPVLDGESPVAYSDTEPGAQFVLDLIDRLEHGVFS